MKPLKYVFFLSVHCALSATATGQGQPSINYQSLYQIHIRKATGPIKIDGNLSEASWQQSDSASSFWEIYPIGNRRAKTKTSVTVTFDETNLYIGAVLYDSLNTHVIPTLRRDDSYFNADNFSVAIDPMNEKANGYFFAVNPANVQIEDVLGVNAGSLSYSWDTKWYSATQVHVGWWSVEMAIPLKIFKYRDSIAAWGINFQRIDRIANQIQSWVQVPRGYFVYDIGYTGKLVWDNPAPKPGSNGLFLPYLLGTVSKDQVKGKAFEKVNAGLDAKFTVGSSMNLDVTVNPDFSQVDVDQQVTNLTRFSVFFPEKRSFFLENNDVFSKYGSSSVIPFYSRRIGLDKNGNTIPIIGGARISGNLDRRTRIGIMDMQLDRTEASPGQNFAAISVNRKILNRSAIKFYFLNRQGFQNSTEKVSDPLAAYGRNTGAEFNYITSDGVVNATAGYHISDKPDIHSQNKYYMLNLNIQKGSFYTSFSFEGVGKNYYTDMGFATRIDNYDAQKDSTVRLGYNSLETFVGKVFFPKKFKALNNISTSLSNSLYLNTDGSLNERSTMAYAYANFKNSSGITLSIQNTDTRLLFHTSFTDKAPLPPGAYRYTQYTLGWQSDQRKVLNVSLKAIAGQFYSAGFFQSTNSINYRVQPWGNFSLNFSYYHIRFPGVYGQSKLFLVGPRAEINFSNNFSWVNFLQYNTQANNFNINSRIRWRYKPMSDIFLVYTDNYFTDPLFRNKNRAVVLKMNYWLNF